jgi:hypothetical protein
LSLPHHDQADHPAVRTVARVPAHILVSVVVVLVTAGGLVAARGGTPAGDVAETPLPTPVPLETTTPLPTPLSTPLPTPVPPMPQGAVVDTAVTFWGAWLPEEVTDGLNEALMASDGSRSSPPRGGPASAPTASPSPSPVNQATTDTPLPLPIPLPPAPIVTPAPLPLPVEPTAVPLPSVPLPLPEATLPPLLP